MDYIANTSSPALTAPITGLSPGITYAIQVAAINAVGVGPASPSVNFVAASGLAAQLRMRVCASMCLCNDLPQVACGTQHLHRIK